jgi:hypothetical protein
MSTLTTALRPVIDWEAGTYTIPGGEGPQVFQGPHSPLRALEQAEKLGYMLLLDPVTGSLCLPGAGAARTFCHSGIRTPTGEVYYMPRLRWVWRYRCKVLRLPFVYGTRRRDRRKFNYVEIELELGDDARLTPVGLEEVRKVVLGAFLTPTKPSALDCGVRVRVAPADGTLVAAQLYDLALEHTEVGPFIYDQAAFEAYKRQRQVVARACTARRKLGPAPTAEKTTPPV